MDMLLKTGVDVNAVSQWSGTALRVAVKYGHQDVIERLLSAGVDINLVNSNKDMALYILIINGYDSYVQALLESLDAVYGNSNTPLHLACKQGALGNIEELLDIQEGTGKMPVDFA